MSYYTMSNKELSLLIRRKLKENGFTSKDISVSVKTALYDTSVNITVKNPFIRISDVENIAKSFNEIDYDEHTGEVLAGCNVYVHVEYEYGIFKTLSAALLPVAQSVFNNPKFDGKKIAQNEKTAVHLIKINNVESRLYEFERISDKRISTDGYIVRSPYDLAIAMWRFKNIGTIYA